MIKVKNEDIYEICHAVSKKLILPKYKNLKETDIMKKKNNEVVTSIDINVENKLKSYLSKILPNSNIIGEESSFTKKSILDIYKEKKYCWTIDPIDGTNNLSKGKDKFAIMIALSFFNKILQSWIYQPTTNDFFYAIRNKGSFFNNYKLKSNNTKIIKKSIGSISTKYWDSFDSEKLIKLKQKFYKISSYGSIGLEYVDIAKGVRDFAILSKLNPWDHLPGILILRESGGFDQYFDQSHYNFLLDKKNLIVASNKLLGNKIINCIREEL